MEYKDMLWDNNQNVDQLISKVMRLGIIVMLTCIIVRFKNVAYIEGYGYYIILGSCCVILFIPTILVDWFRYTNKRARYTSIFCATVVTIVLLSYFKDATFLISIIPIVLASLYFDSKLEGFSILLSSIGLVISQSLRLYQRCLIPMQYEAGVNGRIVRTIILESIIFIAICWVEFSLSRRSSKLFKNAFDNSDALMRNRDGLDVIVDNTDILFRARSYSEIISIIRLLIQNLFQAIETSACELQGYIGIKCGQGKYFGIDECEVPVKFLAHQEELRVTLQEHEYTIPISECADSSTVFISKNKLTMHFYVSGELFAFVIMHMNLQDTDEVLNKLVRVLYRNIHLALNNIKLTSDMYQTQEELVRAFSEISESKSGQTGKHIKRVSEYMKIMADAINLEESERNSLVIASMMHDIGKLLIPESIIEKPGKLTSAEFEIIKTHVHLGYQLLEYSPGRIMEIARIIALQHHEKWDGTGYLGIRGDQIDYYSRLMAVVDVFDALLSKRSYKESWSIEQAYNEIISQSGKHFDPAVVELFRQHFGEFIKIINAYPYYEKNVS